MNRVTFRSTLALLLVFSATAAIADAPIAPTIPLPLPGVSGLSGTEQFYLTLFALMMNGLIAVLTLWTSTKTHNVVNGRMDEFKAALLRASEKSISEFKAVLQKATTVDVHEATAAARDVIAVEALKATQTLQAQAAATAEATRATIALEVARVATLVKVTK